MVTFFRFSEISPLEAIVGNDDAGLRIYDDAAAFGIANDRFERGLQFIPERRRGMDGGDGGSDDRSLAAPIRAGTRFRIADTGRTGTLLQGTRTDRRRGGRDRRRRHVRDEKLVRTDLDDGFVIIHGRNARAG